jgi:hypothetical protein
MYTSVTTTIFTKRIQIKDFQALNKLDAVKTTIIQEVELHAAEIDS